MCSWSGQIDIRPEFLFDSPAFIACAMYAVWCLHWKHVFDPGPFWPNEAVARATLQLRRIYREITQARKTINYA